MSRTYSNFLLFEDVLDNIPSGSDTMRRAASLLLNPTVKIVEEDCNTFLGKIAQTSQELQGYTEVATKTVMTQARINTLLGSGQYKTGIRTLRTCQSHLLGGVCRTCYKSSMLNSPVTTAALGTSVIIPSYLVYQTDVLVGSGYTATFSLSETSDDWYATKVISNGVPLTSGFTIGTNSITFTSIPAAGSLRVVQFIKQNLDPFLGYMAKTYSGALLGIQPLPSLDTFLRISLYEPLFPDSYVELMLDELSQFKAIPATYKDYLSRVHDRMEKVLLAMYLYGLYANVEV